MAETLTFLAENWPFVLATLGAAVITMRSDRFLGEEFQFIVGIVGTIILLVASPVFAGIYMLGILGFLTVSFIADYMDDRHGSVAIPRELDNGNRYRFEKMEVEGSMEWVLRPTRSTTTPKPHL